MKIRKNFTQQISRGHIIKVHSFRMNKKVVNQQLFKTKKGHIILFFYSDSYSVMQSDRNSFGGDVVSGLSLVMILILYNIIRKCILTTTLALKPNFMSSLLCAVLL